MDHIMDHRPTPTPSADPPPVTTRERGTQYSQQGLSPAGQRSQTTGFAPPSSRHGDFANAGVPPPAATWMSAERVQNLKLHEVILPGAHNAHAYKILGKFPIKLDHIICHEHNVYDLLCMGIRALDVRMLDDRWCCVGRWRTIRFVELANMVGRFANAFPSELVVLIVGNGFNQIGSDHQGVETIVQEASGFRVAKTVTPDSRVSGHFGILSL